MTDQKLYDNLSKLGLPLFEPSEELDLHEILAEVVSSYDTRLWESFPVLLATAGDNEQFSPEQVEERLESEEKRKLFRLLVLLSISMFAVYHLSFPWLNKLKKSLPEEDRQRIKTWRNVLVHDQTLPLDVLGCDAGRVKRLFELYFEKRREKDRKRQEKFKEFSLEYSLSQIFSPKQKELFKKKVAGLPLNKTEQEYFSRAVKKKIVALANSELHGLARNLLEQ